MVHIGACAPPELSAAAPTCWTKHGGAGSLGGGVTDEAVLGCRGLWTLQGRLHVSS